nr:hypothetical protein [Tanacetum cinerariifolium]
MFLSLLKLGLRGVYTGQNGVSPMVAYSTPLRPARTWWTMLPPGYFSELRHMHNEDFLRQYNINLAWQVAMGSQLRLRFEQKAKLLRKSVAQVARRDQRIQSRESEIKNLKALLETEAGMKRAAKEKSVDALQRQVSGEETLKAAFEDYKRQQDQMVKQRCAKMDARLDALSIDFDKELYPHMLTAIAGGRWVIGHGLRLAMMKCAESLEMRQAFADVVSAEVAKGMSEGLKHGVEHGHVQLSSLKDLKYPLLDQLEGLKDASMDVITAALYLESDTRGDVPQFIRDLRPSSSQLAIPLYSRYVTCRCGVRGGESQICRSPSVAKRFKGGCPTIYTRPPPQLLSACHPLVLEVRDPQNPWAFKEEIKLSDAIAANISRAEKKKKCRIVCRTHGVGSAHHARSDGVPVSVPTVVPQGLALLLVDAATQTDFEDA